MRFLYPCLWLASWPTSTHPGVHGYFSQAHHNETLIMHYDAMKSDLGIIKRLSARTRAGRETIMKPGSSIRWIEIVFEMDMAKKCSVNKIKQDDTELSGF